MSVRKEHRRAGVAIDSVNREPDDFYPTPPEGIWPLLAVERFDGPIWEPACGSGSMSRVLIEAGYEVISSDLVDRGYGTPRVDFLLEHRTPAPNLMTNPPNKYLDEFMEHAIQIVPGKIALLARTLAITGGGRWEKIYEKHPPARVYVFAPRGIQLWRGGKVTSPNGSVMDLAWFIWDPTHCGPHFLIKRIRAGQKPAPESNQLRRNFLSEETNMAIPLTWRDRVKVHPAAELFGMLPPDELRALAKDIGDNGLRQGVVFWTPEPEATGAPPEENYLLDGVNRCAAIDFGFPNLQQREAVFACALHGEIMQLAGLPDIAGPLQLYGNTDPYEFVRSVNHYRRHHSAEQRRERIERLLKLKGDISEREIARLAKVRPTTVGKVRDDLEQAGQLSRLDTRTDRRGYERPASRPAAQTTAPLPPGKTTSPTPPHAPSQAEPVDPAERETAMAALDRLLDRDLAGTVAEISVRLRQRQPAIEATAIKTRQALGRDLLRALHLGAIDVPAMLGR